VDPSGIHGIGHKNAIVKGKWALDRSDDILSSC
jgi:hypothetical protein